MNTLKNDVILVGNLGSAPQITLTEKGWKVARFQMATNDLFKDSTGQNKKRTEWHRVFAWGDLANAMDGFAKKGKKYIVHGKLVNRTYMSREGQLRKITEVQASQIFPA